MLTLNAVRLRPPFLSLALRARLPGLHLDSSHDSSLAPESLCVKRIV